MQPKTPWTVWLFFALSWLLGGWLVFDGLHQRLFGDYIRINGQLGPWAALVQAIGLDPQSLSWFFISLGLGLISASFGVYLRRPWGYRLGLITSIISLFYLGLGLPAALACLILLMLPPTRSYITKDYVTRDPKG
jgi:hypothetical protein